MEETLQYETQEQSAPEVAVEAVEPEQAAPEVQAQPQPVLKETEQAKNFRAIREAAERAARERDEALQRLAQYESRKPAEEYDDSDTELNLKDDELAEGKHLQKLKSTIKKLEAKQKSFEQQSYANTAEVRLRSQYSDFDRVMTLENIKTLSAAYPELAKSINASSDLYDKAVSAYTLIKRFGIYEDQPYEAEKQKAALNIIKPRPLSSVSAQQGDSPLSRANAFANGLTEELKQQLRQEMAAASKKY